MRWPWQKRERRQQGSPGDFSDAVVRYLTAQAAGSAADASSTAAVEAASGLLSRALAAAVVQGPSWVQETVTPRFLGQCGRDLIRRGESLHAIRMDRGQAVLVPCSSWSWEGTHLRSSWRVRATAFGPSESQVWWLPYASVVLATWGSSPGQTYRGTSPLDWANTTARLSSESDRSLADEVAGPLAQILAVPPSGAPEGNDADGNPVSDPLAELRADIKAARGSVQMVETTSDGWGEGRDSAPRKDWQQSRLGPQPPEAMVSLRQDAFLAVLASCGCPPDLFAPADGTAQREALRRWHMGTVEPLARLLAVELTEKLDAPVTLSFDSYAKDLAGRAQAFQKLVAGGVAVNEALAVSGLLGGNDDD